MQLVSTQGCEIIKSLWTAKANLTQAYTPWAMPKSASWTRTKNNCPAARQVLQNAVSGCALSHCPHCCDCSPHCSSDGARAPSICQNRLKLWIDVIVLVERWDVLIFLHNRPIILLCWFG